MATTSSTAFSLSPRMRALKNDIMARGGSWVVGGNPYAPDVALWHAWQHGGSIVQIRATALHELVSIGPIAIYPGWHLAGEHLIMGPMGPFYGFCRSDTTTSRDSLVEFNLTTEQCADVESIVKQWQNRCAFPFTFLGAPSISPLEGSLWQGGGHPVYSAGGWVENHSIRDYAKVLRVGFAGIKAEVQQFMAEADITAPDYPKRRISGTQH
ncbi:MAG TPA: hypothetical protein VHV83_08260 [Armatimonadota bacterium]|nr:hypothetical protein [Armatimonadota bacterium]